jgi:hypothetical protein
MLEVFTYGMFANFIDDEVAVENGFPAARIRPSCDIALWEAQASLSRSGTTDID